MTRPNKRKQLAREMVKERERQRKSRKLQENKSRRTPEHGCVDSEDDELEDEVLVSEAEELEQVNESAFARLMASSIGESRKTSFGDRTVLKFQRGPTYSKRHQKRLRRQQKDREKTMENCPGILNFFPRKEKSKDSTTGQPEEVEDGEEE
ncbi:hypothetical protein V8E54_009448, partial [Elaphomyces granulatus]